MIEVVGSCESYLALEHAKHGYVMGCGVLPSISIDRLSVLSSISIDRLSVPPSISIDRLSNFSIQNSGSATTAVNCPSGVLI